jgi:hypothetical protein
MWRSVPFPFGCPSHRFQRFVDCVFFLLVFRFLKQVIVIGELALSGDGDFEGFTVYKGHPYCEACHVRLRLPKCKRCKRSIRDNDEAVEALGGKWCWACFVCAVSFEKILLGGYIFAFLCSVLFLIIIFLNLFFRAVRSHSTIRRSSNGVISLIVNIVLVLC